MDTVLQRRQPPSNQFIRHSKRRRTHFTGEKNSIPTKIGWDSKPSTSYNQLWRMDLQEVLSKTIAMIRGSQEYQDYQKRCRNSRFRSKRQDKYMQAMTFEYQSQE